MGCTEEDDVEGRIADEIHLPHSFEKAQRDFVDASKLLQFDEVDAAFARFTLR
jgi:hypothetical protein